MQGSATVHETDLSRQREVAGAFLAALRAGDFDGLLAVLDPDVLVRIDEAGTRPGAPREIRGARSWTKGGLAFSRHVRFIQPALVNGAVRLVWAPHGRLLRALRFTITARKIAQIEVVANPARLRELDLAVLGD